MTDSRGDRPALTAVFAAILLVGLSAPSLGQEWSSGRSETFGLLAQSDASAPRRLLPRKPVEPETDPSLAEPEALPEPSSAVPAEVRSRSGIEVDRLLGPDPDDIGTIDALSGGLERSMWQGTPAVVVAHLMRQLPDGAASLAMREVLRRLLLTSAIPPSRREGDDSVNLGALRVERLQMLGFLGSASALMELAPQRLGDDTLLRLHANNLLMRGDVGAACAESQREEVRLEDQYWQRLLIFCQVIEGKTEEASLGASLLAESGEAVDPVFVSLVDGLLGRDEPKIDQVSAPTPLLLAMMQHAELPMPADLLSTASPPLLAIIAGMPDADLDLRLAAAENALQFGAMTPEGLAKLYASAPFSGDDLENAFSIAESARSPRGRALLFQAATAQTVPTARAEVLQKALAQAREEGVYPLSLRLYRSMLEAITPSAELSWFAADAAHALYALDRADLASLWAAGLRFEIGRDATAKAAADGLWVVASLSQRQGGAQEAVGTLADWRAAVSARSPEMAPHFLQQAAALFAAQGVVVEGLRWRDILGDFKRQTVAIPDHSYRAALFEAASEMRVGETILLASIIVGLDRVGQLEMGVLHDVVTAMQKIGLADEARALVMEAAVEKGL